MRQAACDQRISAQKGENDDEKKTGTSRIWRDVRRMLELEFPDAAMVSEWGNPPLALRAGYDCDFYLNSHGNGYTTLMRDYYNHKGEDHSYFKKDAGGDINRFLDEYLDWYEDTKDLGYISFITCNHDTIRPRYNLEPDELKIAYATLFTLPGVPFLYYGDEIGMRYLELPTKEGGYYRTGARTPMQWDHSANLGFSSGKKEDLYLPVDEAEDAPTVASSMEDAGSLYHTVKDILALRHSREDLQADASFAVICSEAGKPFVYRRGDLIVAVNPDGAEKKVQLELDGRKAIYKIGSSCFADGTLTVGAQSFAVFG